MKKGHRFGSEWGEIHGNVWSEERGGRSIVIKIQYQKETITKIYSFAGGKHKR